MMEKICVTIKEYRRADGVVVEEHERCYQTKPLSDALEQEKERLKEELLNGKTKIKSASDSIKEKLNIESKPQVEENLPTDDVEADLEVSEVNVEERLSDLTTLFVSGQLEPEIFEAQVTELLGITDDPTQPLPIEIDPATPIVAGNVSKTVVSSAKDPKELPYDSESLSNLEDNLKQKAYQKQFVKILDEDFRTKDDDTKINLFDHEEYDKYIETYKGKNSKGKIVDKIRTTQEFRSLEWEERVAIARRIEEFSDSQKISTVSFMANQPFYEQMTEPVIQDAGGLRRVLSRDFLALPKSDQKKITDEAKEFFITEAGKNLETLYEAWGELPDGDILRENSRLWYDGANKIAQKMSERYDISLESAAAVLATQSPQKDWFQNIEQANRVLHITKLNPVIDRDVLDKLQVRLDEGISEGVGKNFKKVFKDVEGKRLLDIKAGMTINGKVLDEDAATALRGTLLPAYDLAYNEQNYKIYNPEGNIIGDSPNRFGWSGSTAVGNGINAIIDPDNISTYLGKGNKVRNFNNNIVDPNNENGYATIDTHAAGAAMLHSVSASTAGGGLALFTGNASGINPLYAGFKEAYQRTAKKLGVEPRELQSITWEAIRLLMPNTQKPRLRGEINELWATSKKGGSNNDSIRKSIMDKLTFSRPSWSPEASPSFLSRVIRGTRWAGMTLEEIKSSDGGLAFLRKKGYLS